MQAGKSERYERGLALMRQIDGQTVTDNLLADYERLAPDFTKYLIEFVFGEIYAREGDLKHREIVAISTLATMGGADRQLQTHVHGALNVGLTEKEILEVILTLVPYIGFPKALNAMAVVKRVVDKRSGA